MRKVNIALLSVLFIASLVVTAAYGYIANDGNEEGGAYCQRGSHQCQLHESGRSE